MWKLYMWDFDTENPDATCNTTCHESEVRFRTDIKLLWEAIERSYKIMCDLSSGLGIHRPRTKYLDVEKAILAYRKQRNHKKSQPIG